MAHNPEYTHEMHEQLTSQVDWKWMLALGVVMIVGGLLALGFPFLASLTVEAIAGAAFLIAGAMEVWMAFRNSDDDKSDRWMNGILGAALVVLAVALLANPLAGLVSLTLTVGLLFLVFGGVRLYLGLKDRSRAGWAWITASGAVSVALGLLVVFTLPASAFGILGIFLGVDLISSGVVSVMLALSARNAA